MVLSFFLNQLKTALSLNCLLCIIHLWWSVSKSAVHSLCLSLVLLGFWFSLLYCWFKEALSTVVFTVCGRRGEVLLLLLLLVDFISQEDSASAIICAASFCVRHGCVCRWYDCVERSLMNSSSEYGVLVFHWYRDRLVGDVCGVFSRHEVHPMEIEVMLPLVNEGTKEVEVVSSSVHADEDDTVFSAQSEDGGGRKAITIEVGMLIHLPVVTILGPFFIFWPTYSISKTFLAI